MRFRLQLHSAAMLTVRAAEILRLENLLADAGSDASKAGIRKQLHKLKTNDLMDDDTNPGSWDDDADWPSEWDAEFSAECFPCGCPYWEGCFCGDAFDFGMCRCPSNTCAVLEDCSLCSMRWPTSKNVKNAHDEWVYAKTEYENLDTKLKVLQTEVKEAFKRKKIAKNRHVEMNKKYLEQKVGLNTKFKSYRNCHNIETLFLVQWLDYFSVGLPAFPH